MPDAARGARGWGGIGPQLAARLAKLDIRGPLDLLLHLPLRYEDETRLTPVAQTHDGESTQCELTVRSSEIVARPRRQLVARAADDSGELVLRFLNFYPQLQKQLLPGTRVRVFGEPRRGFFGTEMVHPRLRVVSADEPLPQALTPVYPTTAGLAQSALRKLVDAELRRRPLQDPLPAQLRQRLGLMDLAEAIDILHHPPPGVAPESLEARDHPAWRRVKFDELLAQQVSLRRAYAARRSRRSHRLEPDASLTDRLLGVLGFSLTGAQRRAWREIADDMAGAHPMQRLLQGDVGSGKTVVAALAMLQAAEAGFQSALMAPTEILAEQHHRKIAQWLAALGLEVVWLSGGQKKRQRTQMLARLAAGEASFAVGTHALIEEMVAFPRLGLAVVDEQHRFGVRQRLSLREKGEAGTSPHMLMMSATPIPRTLAMSFYADLDVSVLDELPPGRTPVVTKLVADTRRNEVVGRVRDACLQGRQAYWVCPLIEESEALELQTAVDTHQHLCEALPELSVGLLHGRMRGDEKAETMTAFACGEIDLLVATTVIEVGVDVANASLMVIEHAERFGLAQLHQLRGRVGRGSDDSVCILMYARPLSANGRARLKVIFENRDGFAIAREDLRLRGPGEFVGARQSGLPLLRFADLERDVELIELARDEARRLIADSPAAADALLATWFSGREGLLGA
ncbi:MAG: ATP-dependent DNA helicase RecG [Rhodocyclaceae bacterium]|nr:ATP-dependent DNA helicase RecG [Rhodocyclaceae bacterium]